MPLGELLTDGEGEALPLMVLLRQPEEDTVALPLGEADEDTEGEPLLLCETITELHPEGVGSRSRSRTR